jgi:hypothetical protein
MDVWGWFRDQVSDPIGIDNKGIVIPGVPLDADADLDV